MVVESTRAMVVESTSGIEVNFTHAPSGTTGWAKFPTATNADVVEEGSHCTLRIFKGQNVIALFPWETVVLVAAIGARE